MNTRKPCHIEQMLYIRGNSQKLSTDKIFKSPKQTSFKLFCLQYTCRMNKLK